VTAALKLPARPAPILTAAEINAYDHVIVAFSGGKDSMACLLHLLDIGVERERIELWHHDVDGREGSDLMDWGITRAYCRRVAETFGIPLYFSWKVGGFEGEMTRNESLTSAVRFEEPITREFAWGTGHAVTLRQIGGTRGKHNTRMRFPQISADLQTRWCSGYLKIDVCSTALRNQERFVGKRTLLVTGERAEEGSVSKDGTPQGRAAYKTFEPHRSDLRNGKRVKRHIDHLRPVHAWDEATVWGIIEQYRVNPHTSYKLGFNRCSCMPCIFGNADHFATVRAIDPERFDRLTGYEGAFTAHHGKTVTMKRKVSLKVLADKGTPYKMREADIAEALADTFNAPIILPVGEWKLPSGAFKESCCGPT